MALIGSDQITITDIRDSISCEISSSNGISLLDASQGTVLTCHLYGAEGEIDPEIETEEDEEDITQDYVYYWTKKETISSEEEDEEEEEFFRTGKSIELTPEDLESSDNNNSFTFYCDVYSVFLEEDGQLIAHGEITLDSTIKKWMNFDESLGLSVQMPGSSWATLTDETGYHVFNKKDETSDEAIISNKNWSGSFAYGSIFVPKIREGGLQVVSTNENKQSLGGGWVWKEYENGDIISPTLNFNISDEQPNNTSNNNDEIDGDSIPEIIYDGEGAEMPEVAEGGAPEVDFNSSTALKIEHFKMELFVDGEKSWYVKKDSICAVKIYYKNSDLPAREGVRFNILESMSMDIVFSFQPYYTFKNNNNSGQGPYIYKIPSINYNEQSAEENLENTGDYYIKDDTIILYIKDINFMNNGYRKSIDDIMNFSVSSCFPIPFALGIKVYDDHGQAQIYYGTYHYFEDGEDLGPLHGFYFNNKYLMFIWPVLAYYKFIPLNNDRLFNFETAVIPSIRYYINSIVEDFNIGVGDAIFLYMNIISKKCIEKNEQKPIKVDLDLECNYLKADDSDYQFPEAEGGQGADYLNYNFEAGSCHIIDAIKRHTTNTIVKDELEETSGAGYVITNGVGSQGNFNYDFDLINILDNKEDTPLIYFTIEKEIENDEMEILYDSREDNNDYAFEITNYDLNIKEVAFYPFIEKNNIEYYDKESSDYHLNIKITNTEKLMPVVGEVWIEPFKKERRVGIDGDSSELLNTIWDHYTCEDGMECIYSGEKTTGFDIDEPLSSDSFLSNYEYYITFYDKTLYQYYNLLKVLDMVPEELPRYSREFGKIVCTTLEDDGYNSTITEDYDGIFPYDRTKLSFNNINAFNIEKVGVGIGMETTGTINNKKFEVAKEYTTHFYGPIAWPLEIYPIGSIYLSVSPENPSQYFGGIWEEWGSGKVPVGVDINNTNFNTVEKTGGAATVTLTAAQIPPHSHRMPYVTNSGSETGTGFSLTTNTKRSWTAARTASATTNGSTGYAGGSGTTVTDPGTTTAHNNLQPYITCYMWKRIA